MRLPSASSCTPSSAALLLAAFLVAAPTGASPLRLGLDYGVEGTLGESLARDQAGSGELRARLGGRMLTPWGELVQSGLSRYDALAGTREVWRDQAYWQYTDAASGLRLRAGDFRAGTSLGWVRSHDMTGLQLRRSGGRAVDTVEAITPDPALLRNVDPRTFSWDALPGLPGPDEAGALPRGDTEFGLQAGHLRLEAGSAQARYSPSPLVSAGLRHGLSDELTAETYAESTGELLRQGLGVVGRLGGLGTLGLSGSYSREPAASGTQWMALYRGGVGNLSYLAGTQLRSAGFHDAQSYTRGRLAAPGAEHSRIDTVGMAWRLTGRSALRVNYVRLTPLDSPPVSRLVNVTHATEYDGRLGWYTSAYRDLENEGDFGVYVGVRISLSRATRADTAPAFDFGARGVPHARLRRSVGSATLGGAGSFRLDQGVRLEAGLYDSYARQTVW